MCSSDLKPGYYRLSAVYSGDAGYSSSGDAGANETFLKMLVATTVVGRADPSTATLGSRVTDRATVTGAATDGTGRLIEPTGGTVTFSYCFSLVATPTSCPAGTQIDGAVTVDAGASATDGIATASVTWTPPHAGYYLLHAAYAPGSNVFYASSSEIGRAHV